MVTRVAHVILEYSLYVLPIFGWEFLQLSERRLTIPKPNDNEEIGDICAWRFGATQTTAAGGLYNVNLNNGGMYMLQQIYVNALEPAACPTVQVLDQSVPSGFSW